MMVANRFRITPSRVAIGIVLTALLALGTDFVFAVGKDESGFPYGYDAVQAAPNSHKVIFENAFVRVLEVTVPPAGETEPMHHHRWPSLFLEWDTGGTSPHIRYRTSAAVSDIPSRAAAVHHGRWTVHWMQPEPMHAIETVETFDQPGKIPLLRLEIKLPQ